MMKLKKTLLIVLIAAFFVSGASGCMNNNKQVTKSSEGKIKFTYWAPMPRLLVSHVSTMADVSMYKELENRKNIEVEFKHPPIGQESEQFGLMIASRDLTDFIEYDFRNYPGGADKAIDDGIILKLNELITSYAPNFDGYIERNEMYRKQSKSDRGDYYGFPALNIGDIRTFGGLMIRQDLLDELGLPIPETLSEWEIALRTLKTQKGVNYPFTGGKTLFSTRSSNMSHHFNSAFNVGLGFYLIDNQVKFGPLESSYQEFLKVMHRWYQEGLLDNEYSLNDGTAMDSKIINGESAAIYGYASGTLGRYMTAMQNRNPQFKLAATQHPVMNKGDEPRFMERQKEANAPFLSVTAICKNPAEAVEWADYFYSEEGSVLKNYGVEGVTYTLVDDKPKYTDIIKKNPDGLSEGEAMAVHFRANYPSPGINLTGGTTDLDLSIPAVKAQSEALTIWSKYSMNAAETLLPPITLSQEESREYSTIMADIDTYCDETILKYIQGTESFSTYDEFIQKLKSIGIDRAIEINQNALNRYNSH